MTDFSHLTRDIEARRRETLADGTDFEALRKLNRDEDGSILSDEVDLFLEWSEALLRRIPKDWSRYTSQPADLKALFDNTQKLLQNVEASGRQASGARGAHLSNLSSRIQSTMSRTVNSQKELLFLQMIGEDRSSDTAVIRERLNATFTELEEYLNSSRDNASKLAEMADASKEATAKIAATGRARVFHLEGKSYELASRVWLGVTALLGVVLTFLAFGFALGWFLEIQTGANAAQIATHLFGKVLILITLGAGVTFAGRQYSANRHNAVQNFHRSSALRTYRALLAATRDEAVHEAILQQAAQAIFTPSETGYSKHGTSYDQTPMVQLVQGMVKEPPSGG